MHVIIQRKHLNANYTIIKLNSTGVSELCGVLKQGCYASTLPDEVPNCEVMDVLLSYLSMIKCASELCGVLKQVAMPQPSQRKCQNESP